MMDRVSGQKKSRGFTLAALTVVICLGIVGISNWAAIGSRLANPLRKVLGVGAVAQMETVLFNFQDRITRWKYDLGLAEPETPWNSVQNLAVATKPSVPVSEIVNPQPSPSPSLATPMPTNSVVLPPEQPAATQRKPAALTPTATPAIWMLPTIAPFGALAGEGIWQPYLNNPDGEVVALRTFLQPDSERPYALVAVVAMDLTKTRLHFVLGKVEPSKPGGSHGAGLIPPEDKQPGKLLAAFNGGFIAEHGQYGAMADGVIPLASRSGLATLAIYSDDRVRIGEWGKDLLQGEDYAAWRQNALMIIHTGEINPKVYTGSWMDWGANLDLSTVTLRSGIGLSADNQVLYYFAGPGLTMPALADAMAAVGVHNGMLLDINPTHALFTAIRVADGRLVAEPLLEDEMNLWVDRYVRPWPWDQDFFYLTAKE